MNDPENQTNIRQTVIENRIKASADTGGNFSSKQGIKTGDASASAKVETETDSQNPQINTEINLKAGGQEKRIRQESRQGQSIEADLQDHGSSAKAQTQNENRSENKQGEPKKSAEAQNTIEIRGETQKNNSFFNNLVMKLKNIFQNFLIFFIKR